MASAYVVSAGMPRVLFSQAEQEQEQLIGAATVQVVGSSTRISIVVVIFIRFSLFPLCNTDGGDHNNAFVSTIINM